jgi:hypothetical protein
MAHSLVKVYNLCRISVSRSSGYEKFYLLGHNTMYDSLFVDVSEEHVSSIFRLKQETSTKHVASRAWLCFMLGSCFAYALTLKTDPTCSSVTLVDFQHTAQC